MRLRALPLVERPIDRRRRLRHGQTRCEHVGARASVRADPAERPAGGAGCGTPRDEQPARSDSTSSFASAWPPGHPCLGPAWACSWRSTSRPSRAGADGLGIVAGEVHALQTGSLKLPASVGTRCASPIGNQVDGRAAPSYHVHSFAAVPARAEDSLGTAEYGAPFVSAVRKGLVLRHPVPREKSSVAQDLRLLADFARICIAAPALGRLRAWSAAPFDQRRLRLDPTPSRQSPPCASSSAIARSRGLACAS